MSIEPFPMYQKSSDATSQFKKLEAYQKWFLSGAEWFWAILDFLMI